VRGAASIGYRAVTPIEEGSGRMATRGQTHNKRAREMALRDKRERKQAKKDQRAAGLVPGDETFRENGGEPPADGEQSDSAAEATQ
jgi:hypothetical protein